MTRRICRTCGDGIENIVELLSHGCDRILSPHNLSRRERNTLLYIEARLVDHAGKLATVQMNYEDRQNMKVFAAADLLDVEEPRRDREAREDVQQVVKFTDAAWRLASECRQYRAIEDDRFDADLGTAPGRVKAIAPR